MIKLFRFLKPYKLLVAAVLILLFFQSLAELFLPTLMSDIVDIGVVKGDISYILRTGIVMLLVASVSAVFLVLANFLSARAATGFGKDLRSKVFAQVEEFAQYEFNQIGTASLITRTTNDITQVQQVLGMIMRFMVTAPMMAIGGIIMAVSKDAQLSLVLVVALPVLAAAIVIVARLCVPLFREQQIRLDKLNLVVRENLTGIRVIRAFNRLNHEQTRFTRANSDLTDIAIKVNKIMAVSMPLMMLVMSFTTTAIIWFGGIRINNGDMQVGAMMAFIQYAIQILFSLMMVSFIIMMLPRGQASALRINEVLETKARVKDPAEIRSADSQSGFVEFRDVTFSYPGAEEPVISNISFKAGPGEVTAIIGGTGSGKSTLISLIPRFYDVDSGSILVDGVDVREMAQESLRAKIGFVPQTGILFTGTIADNIRYGKKDAAFEEVEHAAQVAQAAEFISEMSEGYASVIAQGGTNVSGGQKQRLSIARALIRRPEIYIFDDSFSALDFKTDARLREALKKETAEATVLIVAQRVSTVMDADRIIVLDEGRIMGMGTHRELLNTCEVYREIVSSQLSEEEIA